MIHLEPEAKPQHEAPYSGQVAITRSTEFHFKFDLQLGIADEPSPPDFPCKLVLANTPASIRPVQLTRMLVACMTFSTLCKYSLLTQLWHWAGTSAISAPTVAVGTCHYVPIYLPIFSYLKRGRHLTSQAASPEYPKANAPPPDSACCLPSFLTSTITVLLAILAVSQISAIFGHQGRRDALPVPFTPPFFASENGDVISIG